MKPAARAEVTASEQGGLSVDVVVPGDEADLTFTVTVERDADGDWRVFIPWPELDDEDAVLSFLDHHGHDYEACGGIVHLCALTESE